MLDCLIVGAGPAGLTSAIYLARFHLKVSVIDAGQSRALLIPKTHNHAGYPDGISGTTLVARMRQQAVQYGAQIIDGEVSALSHDNGAFNVTCGYSKAKALTVLLATGVVNRRPQMDDDLHGRALATGRLRYCPICDGFEVTDQKVAVIGAGERGLGEAEFLRSYTRQVSLINPDGPHDFDAQQQDKAKRLGLSLIDGPAKIDRMTDSGIVVTSENNEMEFASIYPALGSDVNNKLVNALDVRCGKNGEILVDTHQRTSVTGLYAAGDVVLGLDQISHAMGEGGVAAVTIRNDLSQRRSLLR